MNYQKNIIMNDHIWIIKDFHKETPKSYQNPKIQKILSLYFPKETLSNIQVTPNGKPFAIGSNIEFSISHSNSFLVLALCKDTSVGVDIEVIRPLKNEKKLREKYFPRHPKEDFFYLWTAHEAFIKCLGEKFSTSVSKVSAWSTSKSFLMGLNGPLTHESIPLFVDESVTCCLAKKIQNKKNIKIIHF